MSSALEIKRALKDAGLEVYRTRGDVVHLAERVRENLLMDAQIFVRAVAAPASLPPQDEAWVGFVVRAQRSDFPNDGEDHLFARARRLASAALERGYHEVANHLRKVMDPGDGERTLDVWCEVSFEKPVCDLEAALNEVRFAMTIEKSAPPTVGASSPPR
jgi:hypothetical protein